LAAFLQAAHLLADVLVIGAQKGPTLGAGIGK
jgi:hypothetical protein